MERRSVFKTMVADVSATGFDGSHFAKPAIDQLQSIERCHEAIDRGINFMVNR